MADAPTTPEPGIYLGMPEDEYFAAPALGSSDMKALYIDPESWWWEKRPESPLREEAERDPNAVKLGKAVHMALLEGLDKYRAHYAIKPDRRNYPGALETVEQMKAWLRERELKVGGNRPQLIERILDEDPTALVWDAIVEQVLQGRTDLTRQQDARIQLTRRFIERDEELVKLLDPGLSEVSVFWKDKTTGALMRARFDRLSVFGPSDLKSFTRRRNARPLTGALRRAADEQWHIQVAHYWEAWDVLPLLPVHGGSDDERALLSQIIAASRGGECDHFTWVFYPVNGAPSPLAKRLMRTGLITSEGETRLRDAKANYAIWTRLYGLETAWIDTEGVTDIDDETQGYDFWRAA